MTEWQPIETAPKDSSAPYICYSPGNPRAHNEYARGPHFHIDGFSERWPRGRNQYPEAPYTHWMPLPEAPAGAA
jgi:hypothetical protein